MNKLSKITTGIAAFIGLIGFFFFIRVLMEGDEAIENNMDIQASIVPPFIFFSLLVFFATIVVTVFFSIRSMVKNPENLKKTLFSLLVLGVLLVASYLFASDAEVTDVFGKTLKDGEAGATSKWVGTGIIYSLALGAVGLTLFVIDLVKGLVKS